MRMYYFLNIQLKIYMLLLIIISILICTYIYYKYIIYRNKCISNIQHKYPNHIAFIMDGNGRWGKKK